MAKNNFSFEKRRKELEKKAKKEEKKKRKLEGGSSEGEEPAEGTGQTEASSSPENPPPQAGDI